MKQKRWRTEQVALETGLSVRTIQSMARRGDIPGAARLGHQWTFDVVKLQRWIKQGEIESCKKQTTSTHGKAFGTLGFTSKVRNIDEAYQRALSLRQKAA